jgi:poly-gamma-glutamate synthesis protein (capsule biosynthesis protein)
MRRYLRHMRPIIYICTGMAVVAAIIVAFGIQPSSEPFLAPPADLTVRLLFTGDMMFDRNVAVHAEQYGADSLMRGAEDLLRGGGHDADGNAYPVPDAVIGNLEGTITTEPSIAQKNHKILHFTFDPKYAAVVKDAGFTAVSLANNHAMDFYRAGYAATEKFLDEAGVLHFGSPYNDVDTSVSFMEKGKHICIIGYHDLYTFDEAPAVAEIERMKSLTPRCDALIVFPHWGVEYQLTATDRQRSLAHEFIDAGADIVIGSHPHVVEPVEIYRDHAIFYSLGNFVFDQGLSFWTEHGLAVQVIIHQDGQKDFKLIPTVLHHAEASVATTTEDIAKVLRVTGMTSGAFSLDR